jgi:hypothetical protein
MLSMFTRDTHCFTVCEPLPPDATVLRRGYDLMTDMFYFTVHSESFPLAAEGEVLPIHEITLMTGPRRPYEVPNGADTGDPLTNGVNLLLSFADACRQSNMAQLPGIESVEIGHDLLVALSDPRVHHTDGFVFKVTPKCL